MDPVIDVLIIILSQANEHKNVKIDADKYPSNIAPPSHTDNITARKPRRIVRKDNQTIRQHKPQVPAIQTSSLATRQYIFEYFK